MNNKLLLPMKYLIMILLYFIRLMSDSMYINVYIILKKYRIVPFIIYKNNIQKSYTYFNI